MLAVFLDLVKRVGIFVIIGQTIQHFGISKKYEKYMKLVISIMVVAQIVFAFGVYMKQFQRQGFFVSGSQYRKEWDINMSKVEEKMKEYNRMVTQKAEEEIREIEERKSDEAVEEEGRILVEKITIP